MWTSAFPSEKRSDKLLQNQVSLAGSSLQGGTVTAAAFLSRQMCMVYVRVTAGSGGGAGVVRRVS